MSVIARQSTARTVTVGPVLDADGVAVTDGVVADFKASKNGAAPAALNGSATLTHRNSGHYSLALTASDLDTVGSVEVVIDDTVNACPTKVITVVEEAVYDGLFAASAVGYYLDGAITTANVTRINGSTANVTNLARLLGQSLGEGYGPLLVVSTVNTVNSQTSFTLSAGSADNDAYNGCVIVIQDSSSSMQKCVGVVSDYVGSTLTVTLLNDPGIYTIAASDTVYILASRSLKPTVDNRTLDVSSGGEAGLDWANVGSPTTTLGLSGTTVKTATDIATQIAALNNITAAAVLAAGDIDGYSLESALKLVLAALSGELSGAGTTTILIRAADDSKVRITATVDGSGNRSALTLDATG
jgi:hypothetical protein